MSNFVSYLLENANKKLGVDNAIKSATTMSLDVLATAFAQGTKQPPKTQFVGVEPSPIKDDLAINLARRVAHGELVVIYNPEDNRTYFVTNVAGSVVAAYYSIGPSYNFYTVISTDEAALELLGITGPVIKDLSIIAALFGFDPPKNVIKQDKETIVPDLGPRKMVWHIVKPPVEANSNNDTPTINADAVRTGADRLSPVTEALATAGTTATRNEDRRNGNPR